MYYKINRKMDSSSKDLSFEKKCQHFHLFTEQVGEGLSESMLTLVKLFDFKLYMISIEAAF